MPITIKLKEVLKNKGISQKQLADMTGLHESTLSDFIRGSRTTINKKHLEQIMIALQIIDFNEILEIEQEH